MMDKDLEVDSETYMEGSGYELEAETEFSGWNNKYE